MRTVEVEEPLPEEPSDLRGDSNAEESFENAVPAAPPTTAGSESIENNAPLNRPSLDEMLARVPSPTKDTLEQLFRLKFIGVRKIKTEELR